QHCKHPSKSGATPSRAVLRFIRQPHAEAAACACFAPEYVSTNASSFLKAERSSIKHLKLVPGFARFYFEGDGEISAAESESLLATVAFGAAGSNDVNDCTFSGTKLEHIE